MVEETLAWETVVGRWFAQDPITSTLCTVNTAIFNKKKKR